MGTSNCKLMTYMKDVTHTQFSDGPWFTNVKTVKKKAFLEGDMPGEKSQEALMDAVVKFLKNPDDFHLSKCSKDTSLLDLSHTTKKLNGETNLAKG